MLIMLGILIRAGMELFQFKEFDLFPVLEVLGIIGLIMIVLEAALDLKLTREKWPIIWKSFTIALLSLVACSVLIAFIIVTYIEITFSTALLYAIPLSIMSSAIIIPSVSNLSGGKKEFMIYESTFSDILGIMFFYFVIGGSEAESVGQLFGGIIGNIMATIFVAIIVSYLLVFVFQNIKTELKLFLLISVLVLLYSIGKMLHLSSLVIILMFGLILENRHIFFRGKLKRVLNEEAIKGIFANFKMITLESSFVVRTFFFVIFGISITLSTLLSFKVLLVSLLVLAVLFGIRYVLFRGIYRNDIFPQVFMAPRGLITILLFFAIPEDLQTDEFNAGILLFVIIFTSGMMAWSLIKDKKNGEKQNLKEDLPEMENTVKPDTPVS